APGPPNVLLHQFNDGFVGVLEKVALAVVIIEADKTQVVENSDESFDFFFGRPRNQRRRAAQMPESTTRSEGSGFIVRPGGYIYTNFHVVEDADKVEVRLKDGRRYSAKIIGSDDKTDIAVIKIDAKDLPVAQLRDSENVRVGELCFAIGVPFN